MVRGDATSMGGNGLDAMSSCSYLKRMNGSASCSSSPKAKVSCLHAKCLRRKSRPYRENIRRGGGGVEEKERSGEGKEEWRRRRGEGEEEWRRRRGERVSSRR